MCNKKATQGISLASGAHRFEFAEAHQEPAKGKQSQHSNNGAQLTLDAALRFKTCLCKTYLAKGFCPYSRKCMFAHGADDLRTPEMNLRDGITGEVAIRQFQRLSSRRAVVAKTAEAQRRSALQTVYAGARLVHWSGYIHQPELPVEEDRETGSSLSDDYHSESSASASLDRSPVKSGLRTPVSWRHDPYGFAVIDPTIALC